jgi:biopolymer transport protein TolQ
METQALELAHQVDFSFWALFLRATLTVKIVMLLLILASFWSWSIIFQRHIKYRGARKEAAQFDRAFWSGEPLDLLYKELGSSPKGYSASVFVAGMTEWERSQKSDGQLIAGVQSRVERSMDVAVLRASDELQKGLTSWPPSDQQPPLSGCSGPFGASCTPLLKLRPSKTQTLRSWPRALPRHCWPQDWG